MEKREPTPTFKSLNVEVIICEIVRDHLCFICSRKRYDIRYQKSETGCHSTHCGFDLPHSELGPGLEGTISNLQTYILPNLHRKPSIYQPFILPNLHFANPSNYQISNLQTYILPNLHRKTFNLPILHSTKPTFCSNTQNL